MSSHLKRIVEWRIGMPNLQTRRPTQHLERGEGDKDSVFSRCFFLFVGWIPPVCFEVTLRENFGKHYFHPERARWRNCVCDTYFLGRDFQDMRQLLESNVPNEKQKSNPHIALAFAFAQTDDNRLSCNERVKSLHWLLFCLTDRQ